MQRREQPRRRLRQIARGRQVDRRPRRIPEAEQNLALPRRSRIQPQPRLRRVMAGELPRRGDRLARRRKRSTQNRLYLFRRNAPGAEELRRAVPKPDDRALQPHAAGAAVQHPGDASREPGHHMIRRRRADPPGRIGRGRGDRPPDRRQQTARQRMRGRAQRHARQPGAGEAGNLRAGLQRRHDGQRAGPEGGGQRPRLFRQVSDRLSLRRIGDMEDEGVETRPVLRGIDRRNRLIRSPVAAEAIDRLGRKGDDMTFADRRRRRLHLILAPTDGHGRSLSDRTSVSSASADTAAPVSPSASSPAMRSVTPPIQDPSETPT